MGRYGYRRPHRSYNHGARRARQHISEAEAFSSSVGGTDEDVKAYFFGLSRKDLKPILDVYQSEHGVGARKYAEETIFRWRTGTTQMSGMVATRLFRLLPRFMPLDRKYKLIESLWSHHSPRSQYSIAFGPNAQLWEIHRLAEVHMQKTVTGHLIPPELKLRFAWLASDDSAAMQQLLNHFLQRDRDEALQALDLQVGLILSEVQTNPHIHAFRRDIKIGGHSVHVFLDPRREIVELKPGAPQFKLPPERYLIPIVVGIGVVVLIFFVCCGGLVRH